MGYLNNLLKKRRPANRQTRVTSINIYASCLRVERLEHRTLLTIGGVGTIAGTNLEVVGNLAGDAADNTDIVPDIGLHIDAASSAAESIGAGNSQTHYLNGVPYQFTWDAAPAPAAGTEQALAATSGSVSPLNSIPQLHSNPGAPVSLFLDFDGHFEPVWGAYSNITTPVYDIDGDSTTFSDGELANIQSVWQQVAEDYAPFNIDVTTVEPSVLAEGAPIANANGVALRVAIGGTDFTGNGYGGYAYIGSFTNSIANVSYVFAANHDLPIWIGNTVSHEAGHGFGLQHQSTYNDDGVKFYEYNHGDSSWAPLMGDYWIYRSAVTTWYNGTSSGGATVYQDDMAILAGTTNGFGYRGDDRGDTLESATALSTDGATWNGAGIIGTNNDVDVFSFTVATGDTYRAAVNVAAVGPNLDAVLELRDSAGVLIASAAPQNKLNAEIVANLTPGNYSLSVKKTTAYGWVGRYTVQVDAPPVIVIPGSQTMTTSEAGGTASFTVSLNAPPTADVTIPVSSSDTTEGTVSTSSLTFTSANWDVPQIVTITGVDDTIVDGNIIYNIILGAASSSDGGYNGSKPADVTVTNSDNDIRPTKFYVVNDGSPDRTYEYASSYTAVENYSLNGGNTAPRGAASTTAGDKVWVVDANKNVYVYSTSGGLLGSWAAGGLNSVAQLEGIATNGTDVWLVDNKTDKVFKYTGAASRLSGSQNAASSFSLARGNTNCKDIVTDGASLWVVDDASTDKIFKYTVAGALVGSWTIDAANKSPTGMTIDPLNVSDIWIVDNGTDKVYKYTAAASRTSGSQAAAASSVLATSNTNAQGIADPPLPGSALTPTPLRKTVVHRRAHSVGSGTLAAHSAPNLSRSATSLMIPSTGHRPVSDAGPRSKETLVAHHAAIDQVFAHITLV